MHKASDLSKLLKKVQSTCYGNGCISHDVWHRVSHFLEARVEPRTAASHSSDQATPVVLLRLADQFLSEQAA